MYKNYWLDKKIIVSDRDLIPAVAAYSAEPSLEHTITLHRMLCQLSKRMIAHINDKKSAFSISDEQESILECASYCLSKADRYNPTKGKAFNFFSTIILGHLRQMYRTARNHQEIKRKYEKFLAQKKSNS